MADVNLMKRKDLWTVMLLGGAVTVPAQASLYNWGSSPSESTTVVTAGPDYSASFPGRNITKIWFAEDTTNYYFRMDLAAGPTNAIPGNGYSEAYAIDISGAGGGDNYPDDLTAGSPYIAAGLSNIKYLLMSHTDTDESGLFVMDHLHTYDLGADGNVDTIYLNGGTSDDNAAVTANDYVVGSAVNRNINQNDLEWEIPISALPAGSFTMYGSTVNSTDGDTYTISGPITVPEPASTSLLVLGGVGVLSRRRRRA